MTKKIILSIMIITSIIGISGFTYFNNKSKKYEVKTEITENKKQEDTLDEQYNEKNKNDEEDTKDEKDKTPKKEEEAKKSSSNKNSNNTTTSNNNPNNSIKETPTQNTQIVQQEQPQQPVQSSPPEPVKESGPWDAWGMTKDQYYNAPLHSWERVDFEASKCGTENACLSACAVEGDTYVGYLYSCDIITSASGKFLGVMLDLEKIN